MVEKYGGNRSCEASRRDGLTDDCGALADVQVNGEYYCNAHYWRFVQEDKLGAIE